MIMKKILSITSLLSLPIAVFATGLNFQTVFPSAGDILTSTGGPIDVGTTARFGTLTGNLDFASAIAGLNTYDDFSGVFQEIGTADFTAASPSNLFFDRPATSDASGINYWLLIDQSSSEQGVFFLGQTPNLGQLSSNPSSISQIAIGSDDGDNVRLQAVPEPSAFALIAGSLGLAWVMVRRRA